MHTPRLEEVFKLSGIPTYTFVRPTEYTRLIVSLRTPGRGLVVEGPSGIGKTTAIIKALEDLQIDNKVTRLSARKPEDVEIISVLDSISNFGTVIIDDFHRLSEPVRIAIADLMKTLADEEDQTRKVIIVGINKAGDSLVTFARDLNNRIDTIRFESNPDAQVLELIQRGEDALNISINTRDDIVREAHGSFHIAQILCHRTCIEANVTERNNDHVDIAVSFEVVREHVLEDLARQFFEVTKRFARGPKFRREGRAPYFHLLLWLGMSKEWSLHLDQELIKHPELKGSVSQIVDKGYLHSFLQDKELSEILHFDPITHVFSAEDPKFIFYLRNLLWSKFAMQVGLIGVQFRSKYDFALSFAGPDRPIAEQAAEELTSHEVEVFYDKNEEHRILAHNIEDYLAPIYRTEARFIVAFLGSQYPQRIWTRFESEQFRQRFGEGSVIPVLFRDSLPGLFDPTLYVGAVVVDRDQELEPQIHLLVELLLRKLAEYRVREAEFAAPQDEENQASAK